MITGLDKYQLQRLADLVYENLDAVRSGTISGYGQSREDEVADLEELLALIDEARDVAGS